MSACLVPAMLANATRSVCVIRCPASIPASSASSWESCSLACTVAISPMAGALLVGGVITTLLVWIRNSLIVSAGPWL